MRSIPHLLLQLFLVTALSLYVFASPRSHPTRATSHAASSRRSQEAGEITKANWQQHPKIKAIRAVVQAVKASLGRKAFTVKRRAFEYCEPYEDTARTIATDTKGLVRFYQNEGGSDDSALKLEHYYDERGRLRFVFITGGAANGSRLEHRIYFDEDGKRIWEDHVYKTGPGYTFPEVWPDDQLQFTDAAGKFSSKPQCPEVKRAGKARKARSRK